MVLFEPMVQAGMLYIANSPLYRLTSGNSTPIYLRSTVELNNFFSDEAEKNFSYFVEVKGKSVEVKTKAEKRRLFSVYSDYMNRLEYISGAYRIDPDAFELGFLKTFDPETFEFSYDKKVKVDITDDNRMSIVGFHRDDNGSEYFLSLISVDAEKFFDDIVTLHEMYMGILMEGVALYYKGTPIDDNSVYSAFKLIQKRLTGSYKVLRFKGYISPCKIM